MALVKRYIAEWVVYEPLFVKETVSRYSSQWFRTFPEAEAELEMMEDGVDNFQSGKVTAQYFSDKRDPAEKTQLDSERNS